MTRMPSRMRRPETLRLPLSDDDWIDVKKHLTAGEQRRVFARMVRKWTQGEAAELEPTQAGLSLMVGYLLDWSIQDADGNAVAIRGKSPDVIAAMLEELDP